MHLQTHPVARPQRHPVGVLGHAPQVAQHHRRRMRRCDRQEARRAYLAQDQQAQIDGARRRCPRQCRQAFRVDGRGRVLEQSRMRQHRGNHFLDPPARFQQPAILDRQRRRVGGPRSRLGQSLPGRIEEFPEPVGQGQLGLGRGRFSPGPGRHSASWSTSIRRRSSFSARQRSTRTAATLPPSCALISASRSRSK